MTEGLSKPKTQHRGGKTTPDPKDTETLDDKLEQGLEESFPGSDPVAITQPPSNKHEKRKH